MVSIMAKENKVIVYSTPTCPWCVRAKDYLKKNNIAFEDVNVATNIEAAEDMVRKSGQMGVPVLDVNGTIIVGFNEPAIKKALNF